jgi:quinol monooxygenase YgiN
MIVVNAIIESTPDDITILKEAIGVMEKASRAEPGCDDYTFCVELNNPGTLRIVEKWQSVEALMEHMGTAHMAEFQQAIGANPPTAMDVKFYEVKEIQPF